MGEAPDPNTVTVDPREGGQKLLQFLQRRLDLPPSLLHRWIRTGLVAAGDAVRLPPFALGMSRRSKAAGSLSSPAPGQEPRPRAQALPPLPRPLLQDGDLWVFCKPAGLPTHPGTGHEDSLSSRLAARAGDAPFKPTPVHRLDKDTSGILLVAASFSVLRELTTALRERRMKKEYLAWVEGRWPHVGVRLFRHWLRKETGNGREQMHVRQTGAPGNGETEALLLVRPVRVEQRHSLLLVRLLTGRTHQIRAQLSSLGHPIEGDVKYGARGRAAGTPMYLHAMRVILPDGRRFACRGRRGERAAPGKAAWGACPRAGERPLPPERAGPRGAGAAAFSRGALAGQGHVGLEAGGHAPGHMGPAAVINIDIVGEHMGAVAHQAGFGLEGADHAGAQVFDGGGQADHAVLVAGIGRAAEGHVGQGEDGAAVGHAHAVLVVLGDGHGHAGIFAAGFFDAHVKIAHELVVLADITFHVNSLSRLAGMKKAGRTSGPID